MNETQRYICEIKSAIRADYPISQDEFVTCCDVAVVVYHHQGSAPAVGSAFLSSNVHDEVVVG